MTSAELNYELSRLLRRPGYPIKYPEAAVEVEAVSDRARELVQIGILEHLDVADTWTKDQIRLRAPWIDYELLDLMFGRYKIDWYR